MEQETTFTAPADADLFADDTAEAGLTRGRPSRKMRLGGSLSRSLRRRTAAVAPHQPVDDDLFSNSYGTFNNNLSEMSRLSSSGEAQVMTVDGHRLKHQYSLRKRMKLRWARFKGQVNDALSFFQVSKSMECFGGGAFSYFSFVLWLGRVNFLTMLLYICAIILPYAIIDPDSTFSSTLPKKNISGQFLYVNRCSAVYEANLTTYTDSRKANPVDLLLDVLQGTGVMEQFQFLFIGQYFDKVFYRPLNVDFNTSLGLYLCLWVTLFLILFVTIFSSGRRVLERLSADAESTYTFKVLSRWDFIVRDRRRAKVEKVSIRNELKKQLEEDRRRKMKERMSVKERRRLVGKRIAVWLVYILFTGASLTGIYFISELSRTETSKRSADANTSTALLLLFQYMPSLYIVITNFIIEQYCIFFVKFEEYGGNTQISITIKRTVFLRFISLVVLMVSIFQQLRDCGITGDVSANSKCVKENCQNMVCWETYVGQQVYKLVFLDIILFIGLCLMDLLRKFVCRFIKSDVSTEFNISSNVIDLIYTQTLCWIGMFFCPLLPIAIFVKIIAIYYFKKICVRYNIYKHDQKASNAAQTDSYFLETLLFALIIIVILPLGVATSLFPPSRSCGPYRLYFSDGDITSLEGPRNALDDALNKAFERLGPDVENFFNVLDSYVTIILVWILLIFVIYYFITLSQARDKLNKRLQVRMVHEMQDQAFQQKRALESLKALRVAQAAQRHI